MVFNILIVVFVIYSIWKKVVKDAENTGGKPDTQPQRREPTREKVNSTYPPNKRMMDSVKRAPLPQVKEQPKSTKYIKKESVMQKYEDMDVLRKIEEKKDRKIQDNFIVNNNLLDDLAFPEVLYSGLNYMNIPDTVPYFDIEDIVKKDSSTRSEENEKGTN